MRAGIVILAYGHALPPYHLRILIDNVVQCLTAHHASSHSSHAIRAHHLHDIRPAIIVMLVHGAAIVARIISPVAVHGSDRDGDADGECCALSARRPVCSAVAAKMPPLERCSVGRQLELLKRRLGCVGAAMRVKSRCTQQLGM